MTIHASTIPTPDGAFTILMGEDAVIASGWTSDVASLVALVHPTLRPVLADIVDVGTRTHDKGMRTAVEALSAYYDGDPVAPRSVPVHQQSGEFRMRAWEVLREVAVGGPITYTEFAARSGRPSAVRAAAAACAQNAAALFVPCHRVLRSDGTLGGFRYGLDLKQRLLEREAHAIDTARTPA